MSNFKLSTTFAAQLHFVLNMMELEGLSHVASWTSHGQCFKVHNRVEFMEKILPIWFRQSKYTSFQRQLNLYGFRRIQYDCYYHEKFLQHRPQLAREIKRIAIKGTVGFISSSHCPQDDWGNTRPFALVPLVSDQPATSPVPTISADMPLTPKEAPQRQAEVTLALPCANGATNSSEGTTSRRDKSRWEAEPTLQSSLHELGCCREERDVLMLLLSLRHFETNQKVNQGPLPAR